MADPANPNQQTTGVTRPDPATIYPVPGQNAGTNASEAVYTTAVVSGESPKNNLSVVFGILLLLTFFTPLGAVLFLPMLITGFYLAYRTVNGRQETFQLANGGRSNPIISVVKIVLTLVTIVVVGIIGLIALLFIGVATGTVEFRMGS